MHRLLIFILAAGKGTRMRRRMTKTLHPVAGLPLVGHVLNMAQQVTETTIAPDNQPHHIGLVLSPENHAEISARFADIPCHIQTKQQGTGDAVRSALNDYIQTNGMPDQPEQCSVLVLYGDTPFIQADTVTKLLDAVQENSSASPLAIMGFKASSPANYGRLIMADTGTVDENVTQIIEAKDLPGSQQQIDLCNAGIMAINLAKLQGWLEKLDNDNASQEYYLTDLVAFANDDGVKTALVMADETEVMGVNSLRELAQAEQYWQQQKRHILLAQGVMMQAPETVFFHHDTQIAGDTMLEPHIYFGKNVSVETGAHIKAFCHIEGAHIGENASVGPFARLRPGANLAQNVSVGNFVEVKNSTLAQGVKAGHLSYLGDAEIGENSNIGAGTITCNYDGIGKAKTILGANVFIGSNSALVAPVTIGNDALIGAGSVIGKNVADDELAVSRSPQKNLPNKGMKSKKAKKTNS